VQIRERQGWGRIDEWKVDFIEAKSSQSISITLTLEDSVSDHIPRGSRPQPMIMRLIGDKEKEEEMKCSIARVTTATLAAYPIFTSAVCLRGFDSSKFAIDSVYRT